MCIRDREETVEPTKPAGDFYTQEEAITEAKRCMLCECRGCIDVCDLMQKYKNDPKKLIESINKTLITVEMVSTKVAARQVNSCNACGLCKEVCPKDLDMEEIFLSSRRILHRDGELPPPFHDFWTVSYTHLKAICRHRVLSLPYD